MLALKQVKPGFTNYQPRGLANKFEIVNKIQNSKIGQQRVRLPRILMKLGGICSRRCAPGPQVVPGGWRQGRLRH